MSKFHAKDLSDIRTHGHDEVVCFICMHAACNRLFFVMEAAGRTKCKKKKICDSECKGKGNKNKKI